MADTKKKKTAPKKKPAAPKQKKTRSAKGPVFSAALEAVLSPATPASLAKEAAALGNGFAEVNINLGDLVADANEILGAKTDLSDLMERKFPVSKGLLDRIQILKDAVTPLVVEGDESRADAKTNTAAANKDRDRLLEIRTALAGLGSTVGLPEDYFKLGLRKTDRINPVVQRVSEVLVIARKHEGELPDPKRVAALLAEGEALIQNHTGERVQRTEKQGAAKLSTKQTAQYKRLLFDALTHLSNVGLSAYPDDPTREKRYRLDNIYADRPTAKPEAPPQK